MLELAKHKTKPLHKILIDIQNDLLTLCDTKEESIDEIKHYMSAFPREPDYMIAQHGNLKVYYCDIREMYRQSGLGRSLDALTDDQLWENYKKKVGQVAKYIIDNQ